MLSAFRWGSGRDFESALGSTGFDKMVDKAFETEKKGVWGDTAEWGGEKVVQQVIQEELTTMV